MLELPERCANYKNGGTIAQNEEEVNEEEEELDARLAFLKDTEARIDEKVIEELNGALANDIAFYQTV